MRTYSIARSISIMTDVRDLFWLSAVGMVVYMTIFQLIVNTIY